MRPMDQVRQAILNVIDDNKVAAEFENATDCILDSMKYAAPEIQSQFWREFGIAMEHVFESKWNKGVANTEWGKKAIDIFGGRLNYKDYL